MRFLCVCSAVCLSALGCTETQETRVVGFSLSRNSVAFEVGGHNFLNSRYF